jgi:(+)-abscisic acid 8'-hydroxylase
MRGMTDVMRDVAGDHAAGSPRIAPGSALGLLLAAEPDLFDHAARVENLVLIERLATGDVAGLLDWVFAFLGDEPRSRDDVRAHGRTPGGPRSALPLDPATSFVMETLRLEQSEFLYRRVGTPFAFEGYTIPAGWLLRLCVNEGHRDAAVFPEPHRFDATRFRDRAYSRNEYSPFGGHAHGCMGGHFALFLGRVFVEEVAIGYDWTVLAEGPPERGTRHRDHWRPSGRRRVVMRKRADAAGAALRDPALAVSR